MKTLSTFIYSSKNLKRRKSNSPQPLLKNLCKVFNIPIILLIILWSKPEIIKAQRMDLLEVGQFISHYQETTQKDSICFSGSILYYHTLQPIENARVLLKDGEKVLATNITDSVGQFSVQIPSQLPSGDLLAIEIHYFKHIFFYGNVMPRSQEMNINLYSTMWMEAQEIEISAFHIPESTFLSQKDTTYEFCIKMKHPNKAVSLGNPIIKRSILDSDRQRLPLNAVRVTPWKE